MCGAIFVTGTPSSSYIAINTNAIEIVPLYKCALSLKAFKYLASLYVSDTAPFDWRFVQINPLR